AGGKPGDARQVDLVQAAGEIHDPVRCSHGRVAGCAEHEGVRAFTAPQRVTAAATVDDVVAGTADQFVGRAVADQQVIARTANGVFHGYAIGDGHVAHQAANVGERTFVEVDLLV